MDFEADKQRVYEYGKKAFLEGRSRAVFSDPYFMSICVDYWEPYDKDTDPSRALVLRQEFLRGFTEVKSYYHGLHPKTKEQLADQAGLLAFLNGWSYSDFELTEMGDALLYSQDGLQINQEGIYLTWGDGWECIEERDRHMQKKNPNWEVLIQPKRLETYQEDPIFKELRLRGRIYKGCYACIKLAEFKDLFTETPEEDVKREEFYKEFILKKHRDRCPLCVIRARVIYHSWYPDIEELEEINNTP